MKRRLVVVTAVLVVAFLTAPAAGASAPPAISPANRPTPIAGQTNGLVDPSQLVTVQGTCRLARAAATSLTLMLAAAHGDGVDLEPDDCYRPFAQQVVSHNSACAHGNCACAASLPSTGVQGGTSMHGWGKAVDFAQGSVSITSTAMVAYRWLKANAARFGWNHPGWAEPGGSTCPEAWHWEWVGDGGILLAQPIVSDCVAVISSDSGHGTLTVTGLGAVGGQGDAIVPGSLIASPVTGVVVGAARTLTSNGLWFTDVLGTVYTVGDAPFLGDMRGISLFRPVVGMAATPSGKGYWLVASDGGVFSFGDARFWGSMGGVVLNRPVVGMAATPSGAGYWLVASDGGVFSFGDARFWGSMGGVVLNRPVVGMAATHLGNGYWLVASDGGVFTFGDAQFFGSLGGAPGVSPIVAITATPSGDGYRMAAADESVTSFGAA